MTKLTLAILAITATLNACGAETQEAELTPTKCVFKPVGTCARIDEDTFQWHTFEQTPAERMPGELDLLSRVGLVTCEQCIGQTDNWHCDKHNMEFDCGQ